MPETHVTWESWLNRFHAFQLFQFPESVAQQEWKPGESDRAAAWDLYTELRTRITVQPLHCLHGDEETALTSVADLFKMSREIIRKAGPQARHFATLTTFILNGVIRPFTAKWHKQKCDGALANEDVRHELRGELIKLQADLRIFATVLGALAEGPEFRTGSQSWPTTDQNDADRAEAGTRSIPFDIAFDEFVDPVVAAKIRWHEHNEIRRRRAQGPMPLPAESPVTTSAARNVIHEIRLPGSASPDRLKDIAGLAVSGGGIRSATFALGVVQRLTKAGVAANFDYISTVSGGGYLGSFLSTYLNTTSPEVALAPEKLPFREPDVGESAPLRHLRGHSKYLIEGGLTNRLNMILLAVYGVISTVLIFWPLLAGVLLAVALFQGNTIRCLVNNRALTVPEFLSQNGIVYPALCCILLLVLSLAPVSIFCRRFRKEDKALFGYQKAVAWVITAVALAIVWNLIPLLFWGVERLLATSVKSPTWLPGTAVISGAVAALQRFWATLDRAPAASKLKRYLSFAVMALAGPIFALALFACLGHEWIVGQPEIGGHAVNRIVLLFGMTFGPLLFALLFLDINHSSLHPFYRRKLSEGYLMAHVDSEKSAGSVRPDDGIKLSELRNRNPRAPYHLINSSLNAPSSDNQAVRGRGTDFFLFSQKYCGSAATGYYETELWENKDSHLNLGTAMAISAAAASPFMGVDSIPGGNFLLTLFNVRLDYWLATPRRRHIPVALWRAGPWYLLRQGFGWMDDRSWFVNVSDGGHIENLAVYELLRRRCKFIVAVDGECDPEIRCGSLMRLIRYALIDFGIQIDIDMSRYKKKPDGTVPFHFALAKIEYPALNHDSSKATGYLLYVKLSRTGNEPPHVAYYQSQHAEFPHESTADQFFDEDQFEAYRALGEHAANDLFSSELLGDETTPASLAAWFEALSAALVDPNNM